MAEVSVVPRVALHGVLLEPRAGGIRIKLRGAPAIHLPYDAAEDVAREIALLASAARRVRS